MDIGVEKNAMSAPNPYNQGPYPQQRQPNQQQPGGSPPGPHRAAFDDGVDAIPMQKGNPKLLLAIAGGAVLVLGAAAFTFLSGGKPENASAVPAASAEAIKAEEEAKAKAIREHLEITARSMEQLPSARPAAKPAPVTPQVAAAEPAPAKAAAAPAKAAQPRAIAQNKATAQPKSKPAAPKPASTASRKKADSLDELGSSITTELGR